MPPRRYHINHKHDSYNRVIRLEGQIKTALEIIRFRHRYEGASPYRVSNVALIAGLNVYLTLIDRLIEFVNDDIDFALPAHVGELFDLIYDNFYRDDSDAIEADEDEIWPMVLFMQTLQCTFENDHISAEQAIVEGWYIYVDQERWQNSTDSGLRDVIGTWAKSTANETAQFIKGVTVSADEIKKWTTMMVTPDLYHYRVAKVEAAEFLKEFEALRPAFKLDVFYPRTTAPDTQYSICPICLEQLTESNADMRAQHRPVQTICRHVFGLSCLRTWFQKNETCPVCRESFHFIERNQPRPDEILESCDRVFKWLQPVFPHMIMPLDGHLERLALIFEPVHELREHLVDVSISDIDDLKATIDALTRYRLFLARDRLRAVLKRDVVEFRKVAQRQIEVFAERERLQALLRIHPREV